MASKGSAMTMEYAMLIMTQSIEMLAARIGISKMKATIAIKMPSAKKPKTMMRLAKKKRQYTMRDVR